MDVIIGIIAEGKTDQVVLRNILKGLKIDGSNITFIQPKDKLDETDQKYLGWSYETKKGKEIYVVGVNEEIGNYLQIGDKIIKINNQIVTPKNLYDCIRIEEDTYEVQIERKGVALRQRVRNLMDTRGGWTRVKQVCIDREQLNEFFIIQVGDYQKLIIIQIDTAEADHEGFDVGKPTKSGNSSYVEELRNNVIAKINQWLEHDFAEELLYAITIEELEAWVLTLFEQVDSVSSANPKNRTLKYINEYKGNQGKKLTEKYENATANFSKIRKLREVRQHNQSFDLFVGSVENFLRR